MTHEEAATKELDLIQAAVSSAMKAATAVKWLPVTRRVRSTRSLGVPGALLTPIAVGWYTVNNHGIVVQVLTGYEPEK